MNEIKELKVGILGFGTVGQGTWKHLFENEKAWEKILGIRLIPTRASVRSLDKKRMLKIDSSCLTTNSLSIVEDPDIDIICELIGGIEEARELTLLAFNILAIILIFLAFPSTVGVSSLCKNFDAATLLVPPLSLDILLRKFSNTGEVSSIRVSLLLL